MIRPGREASQGGRIVRVQVARHMYRAGRDSSGPRLRPSRPGQVPDRTAASPRVSRFPLGCKFLKNLMLPYFPVG